MFNFNFAYLVHDICCPVCQNVITNRTPFQWGRCPDLYAGEVQLYKLGDEIQWHRTANNEIFDWSYISTYQPHTSSQSYRPVLNAGDHTITNLVVLMTGPSCVSLACHSCQYTVAGIAIQIKNNCLYAVWIYKEGEFNPHKATIYLLDPTGEQIVRPMPEWLNRRMNHLHENGPTLRPENELSNRMGLLENLPEKIAAIAKHYEFDYDFQTKLATIDNILYKHILNQWSLDPDYQGQCSLVMRQLCHLIETMYEQQG